MKVRALLTLLAAPALALVFSLTVTAVILAATGSAPLPAFKAMAQYTNQADTQVLIINSAASYYIAAIAVAIGFRMGLLNIGIDGQYRLAALTAAYIGGALSLPVPLQVGLMILSAMVAGALWALIAAVLKTTRGVSEIISTIMLNYIATGLVAYLLQPSRLGVTTPGSNNIGTRTIRASGQIPGISFPGSSHHVYGLTVLAVLVGVGYWFIVGRTRVGFDIRAAGFSRPAAIVSGVNTKRLTLSVMFASGACAGLIGLPLLMGDAHTYSTNFPAGVAFTGIAIAILGRNHPIGILAAALLFGFLNNASSILELNNIPHEIVNITQGTIVLSVVISYEFVRRLSATAEQRSVRRRNEPSTSAAMQTAEAR